MKTRIRTLLAFGLLTGSASAVAVPVTTTYRDGVGGYSGTADTYLEQLKFDRNYGGLGTIGIGYRSDRGVQKSLVRFDLSTLDDGLSPGESLNVTSASISFTLAGGSGGRH